MTPTHRQPHALARRCRPGPLEAEQGSAYIITLMVLLVLTLIGLSLTVITQTEMMVGSQQRTMQRVYYSADSGISVATARSIRYLHYEPITVVVGDSRETLGDGPFNRQVLQIEDRVEVTPLLPVLVAPCNGCQVNNGQRYVRASHLVSSSATRSGQNADDSDRIPLARRTVYAEIETQPINMPPDAVSYIERTGSTYKFPRN